MARKQAVGGETEHPEPAHDLRERAESELRARADDCDVPAPDDVPRLLHDLRVHQIELEMQNEELRRAQQELETSRERYFELYDLAPAGYLTISEKGLVLEANLTAARILGIDRAALVGTPITRFIVGDDQDTYYLRRKALFESGEAQRCELRLERADSTPLWAHIDVTLATDSESDSPVCRATLTDITDLKRTEEAFRESEERYALAAAGANDGIWDWDMVTGESYMSPRYKEMLGYAENEIGDSYAMWESLLHPDDRGTAVATMKALQSGEISEFQLEYRLRHKDGGYRWVLDLGKAVRDEQGRPHRAAGSHTDITDRKLSEEALRTSEARYASFIDATDDLVFIKDDELRYLVVNQANADFLGRAVADVVGLTDEDLMPPDAAAGCRRSDLTALENGETVIDEEPVGDRIYEVRKFQVTLGSGGVGVGGYARDITEQRRAQTALTQAFADIAAGAERLRATLHDTVKAMDEIVGLRDPYTARHEKSVTRLALAIAEDLGLDEQTREGLMLAGEVHDIGKICVPAEILSKPAALTDMEYRLVQQHAQTGREILSGITFQQPVAEIVGQHHERLDGSGYPDGLAGGAIRIEARILAVADVIEAMASHRPYRPALGMEAALAEVRAGAGKVYDADVAAACERVIAAGFSLEEPEEGR